MIKERIRTNNETLRYLFSHQHIMHYFLKLLTQYKSIQEIRSINIMLDNKNNIIFIINGLEENIINSYDYINKSNNPEIYLKFNLKKIKYQLNENKFITFLRIINSKNIHEMQYYAKDDAIMNEVIIYLKKFLKN